MSGIPNQSGTPNQSPVREPAGGGMLTDLSFLDVDQVWPPMIERLRLEHYEDNRWLWRGEHDRVFNDWQRLLRADQLAVLEFVFNLPKRLSTLWADLLLGEPPSFQAGDEDSPVQKAVDDLVTRNMLVTIAYEVMIDASRYGDGLFKIRKEKGKAVIEGQPPALWFPIASRDNVRDVTAHVLAWTFEVVETDLRGRKVTTNYLRAEIHTKGQIQNRAFVLDKTTKGMTIDREIDVRILSPDRRPIESTGVDDFLVIPVSGLRTTDEYYGLDDYRDLVTLLLELETRVGQISRILDMHSDPSMYGDPDALEKEPNTGESIFRAGGKYFPVQSGDSPPGYVTWDGQLAAAFMELDKLLEMFYLVSETSPAAFGQMDAGLATSGTALRRLMMAPLAKVNRIRLRLEPALKRLIMIAMELENSKPPDTIEIHWRDGLPEDPVEQSQIEVARKGAGLTSTYSALKRLDNGSESATQDELQRIDEEAANSAAQSPFLPSIRIRGGANGNANDSGTNGDAGQSIVPDPAGGATQDNPVAATNRAQASTP